MKRQIDKLYSLKGYPSTAEFTNFKADLFAYGTTPAITMDSAVTNGISVTGATTTGIRVTGSATTALNIGHVATNASTGIRFIAAYLGHSIVTGTYASAASNGVKLTSVNDYNAAFLADDGGANIGASVRNLLGRTYISYTQAGGSIRSVMGQLKVADTKDLGTGVYAAVQAYLELAGATSVKTGGKVSGLDVSMELAGSKTSVVDSGGYFAGVKIELTCSSGTATFTQTGDSAAVYIDKSGTVTDWKVGVDINNCTTGVDIGAATTGVNVSGTVTTGINIAGTATQIINVAAAGNVTAFASFNAIAGCVTSADVNPKDTPSAGGLGADGAIKILINGQDYWIPIFAIELT